MKKSHITLLSILLIIILLISGVFLLKDKNNEQSKEENVEELSEEIQAEIITYEDGDFIYVPANEDIGYDDEEKAVFYENLLNIYITSEISNEQAEEIANTVDGTIVGKIQGAVNVLQLQVQGESFYELNQLANRFDDLELVKFASLSIPISISDLSVNEAESDNDVWRDSEDYDKENWWAKAINADDAWDYLDKNKEEFDPVKVAVLERGKLGEKDKNIDDNDIKDSDVDVVDVKDTKFEEKKNDDYPDYPNHATLVTKIIAANKHSKKIRGIATGFVDVDFYSIGEAPAPWYNFWDGPDTVILRQIKSILKDGDVRILNNSWGERPWSEKKFEEEKEKENPYLSHYPENLKYKDLLEAEKESRDGFSAQLIIVLDELLKSEDSNFLIVQSAGNGYMLTDAERKEQEDEPSEEAAVVAEDTGYFANINENTYNQAVDLNKGKKLNSTLGEILNHIIVVGGAQQKEDGYESPKWTSFGNAIDIAAPSEDLIFDGIDSKVVWGTSYSAPMVSGAAALIWSYKDNDELKAGEVKELLLNSAQDNVVENKGSKCTYPMLNVTAFLNEYPYNTAKTETDLNEHPHYNELVEEYRTAIREQWKQNELGDKGLGPYELKDFPLSDNYGYELRDINGNGLPELVLGVSLEDEETDIDEIYTLQNNMPVKVFESGIRTHVHIYKNGTIEYNGIISPGRGIHVRTFYKLGDDGIEQWKEGYEGNIGEEPSYECLTDPAINSTTNSGIDPIESMAEEYVETINEKYKEDDIIEHSFTPFVSDKEEADEDLAKNEKEKELSDEEIEDIVRDSYSKLEKPLLEVTINDLFDKHHEVEDAQRIWKSGVDPNDPFYEDVYDLLYPEVSHLITKEGMEFFINQAYSVFWQPPAPISFFGPVYDLEVLNKNSERFKVKQTKEIGPQEKGGTSHDLIYMIEYVKEDGEWKLAGAKKQE